MPLTTIEPRETAAGACARSLRTVVLGGELGVGDRLPPERRLAETLGVNRVTVRAALAQLVAEGLLAVRQGSGYVVRDYLDVAGPELLVALAKESDLAEQVELVRDVLELRRGVARVVLERLAQRAPSRTAVARVKSAIDALEALVASKAPAREVAEADLAVMAAVVASTGSQAFRLMVNPVAALLKGTPRLIDAMFKKAGENVESWRALVLWLEAPSADTVELALTALAAHDEATLQALRRKS